MGKSARAKVAKNASKVKSAVSTTSNVLSKGQRVRKEKRESKQWKKEILDSVIRNKKVDNDGLAFGTLDDLSSAIAATEFVHKPAPKKKGSLKRAALHAQRLQDLETLNRIYEFQPFRDDPLGTIKAHLCNTALSK